MLRGSTSHRCCNLFSQWFTAEGDLHVLGVSDAWSHQTQETSQNFCSWVGFPLPPPFQMKFSKSVCWPPGVKFSSGPSEARTAVDFVYAKSQPFWLSAQFFFHWHHFYTCVTFDPQWYCSSLTLAHFEWCLKHPSAILQLPAHNLILCDVISLGALCNRQPLRGCERLEKNKTNCSK